MSLKSFSDKKLFEKYFESKNIHQSYITFVKNHILAEELFQLLEKRLLIISSNIEVIKLNGLELEPETFHTELCTIPMFSDIRLIWLKHADSILKTISQDKTILSYFERDFKNLSEKTFIIIQIDDYKLPKKIDFFSQYSIEFQEKKVYEKDFPDLIRNKVKLMDFKIEEKAVQLVIEKSGANQTAILASLDKLFTFCLHEKEIFEKDVYEVCHDTEEDLYFKILNLIADRNIHIVLKMLLKYKIVNGNKILSGLAKLFSNAFRYRLLRDAGIPTKEIHQQLKLNVNHQYIYQKDKEKFYKMNRNFSLKEFHKIFIRLQRLDEQIKSSSSLEAHRTFLVMFISSLS